jgi:hypothetical protein
MPTKTIKLLTRTGDFVAEIEMPAFDPMPEGVLWGQRAFFLDHEQYREGFLYVDVRAEISR